jgi:acetyltransferase-like isoleucine patch superfamily enzyme
VPGWYVSLVCMWRFRAQVSPRAEVELSKNLRLGRGTVVSSYTKIKATGGVLQTGARTQIATGCFLDAQAGGLIIGSGVLIGPNCVLVTSSYHHGQLGVPLEDQGKEHKGSRIGNNVFIGSNSVILDGSDIGDDVIVTPCSVVSGRVAPRAVVSGNPARTIFTRR